MKCHYLPWDIIACCGASPLAGEFIAYLIKLVVTIRSKVSLPAAGHHRLLWSTTAGWGVYRLLDKVGGHHPQRSVTTCRGASPLAGEFIAYMIKLVVTIRSEVSLPTAGHHRLLWSITASRGVHRLPWDVTVK